MFRSGFISIIGSPNTGKSTLLNLIVGEKIAITTHKPQTTRNRITGIRNVSDGQLIFLDTPGIHRASTPLNLQMTETALGTLESADILLFLTEAGKRVSPEDQFIIRLLKKVKQPVILAINKIDLVNKPTLLPLADQFRQLFPFREILFLSALKGEGVPVLIEEIRKLLPEGPRYFPEDMMTDRTERFIAAEIIREKITLLTHRELPYATAVVVDTFREDEGKNLIRIQATIIVEKDSQKGIIIGKKGAMLKEIGTRARRDMEKFFAARIFLELFVRVQKDWSHDIRMLRELGYTEKS
ncbi:MAG: GTPase Era [Deltaproteobacteria bacterium]|nr:GTPase Era [Deltaproteobacteria bacterium]